MNRAFERDRIHRGATPTTRSRTCQKSVSRSWRCSSPENSNFFSFSWFHRWKVMGICAGNLSRSSDQKNSETRHFWEWGDSITCRSARAAFNYGSSNFETCASWTVFHAVFFAWINKFTQFHATKCLKLGIRLQNLAFIRPLKYRVGPISSIWNSSVENWPISKILMLNEFLWS